MKILDVEAAAKWCEQHNITLSSYGRPIVSTAGLHVYRAAIPQQASRHFSLCRLAEDFIRPWNQCLLWITEWGVWSSSENWHLFYRLRQSYGYNALLEHSPAQLFLEFELFDLVSFMQVAIGAGWDLTILTNNDYSRIGISHNEWIEFVARDELALGALRSNIELFS